MKTFYWIPREGMQSSVTPAVQTVKFGDGYEQRRPAGLNFRLKSFKPVFRVTSEEERQALEDFLFDHSGVKAFLWRPPKHNRTIRIVCREWSVTDYACYTDFNCTFEQVVI